MRILHCVRSERDRDAGMHQITGQRKESQTERYLVTLMFASERRGRSLAKTKHTHTNTQCPSLRNTH